MISNRVQCGKLANLGGLCRADAVDTAPLRISYRQPERFRTHFSPVYAHKKRPPEKKLPGGLFVANSWTGWD